VLFTSLRGSRTYLERFDGKTVFYPNGEPLQPGTRFRQPALARTLKLIAEQGLMRSIAVRSATRSSRDETRRRDHHEGGSGALQAGDASTDRVHVPWVSSSHDAAVRRQAV
jgi:hypothetical protein